MDVRAMAEAAAAEFVAIREDMELGDAAPFYRVLFGRLLTGIMDADRNVIDKAAGVYRRALANTMAAFGEALLRASPVPGGIPEAELGKILTADLGQITWSEALNMLHYCRGYVAHLHAVMRCPEAEAYAAGYDAGRKAGYAEREADEADEEAGQHPWPMSEENGD